jgi:hypothetical protein
MGYVLCCRTHFWLELDETGNKNIPDPPDFGLSLIQTNGLSMIRNNPTRHPGVRSQPDTGRNGSLAGLRTDHG